MRFGGAQCSSNWENKRRIYRNKSREDEKFGFDICMYKDLNVGLRAAKIGTGPDKCVT